MRVTIHVKCLAIIGAIVIYSSLAWTDSRKLTEPTDRRSLIENTGATSAQPLDRPANPGPPGTAPQDLKKVLTSKKTTTDGEPDPEGQAASGDVAGEGAPPANNTQAPVVEETPAREPEAFLSLEPEFVRTLTPIAAGSNDSNPTWSPSGEMVAFERSIGDQRNIVIALRNGTIIKTIHFQPPEEESALDIFLPGITDTASYNAGMSWSGNSDGLVFMSNAGSGNYDLYLLANLKQAQPMRLTSHHERESHPHWSPVGRQLVYVSGSTGKANIFTMDLASRRNRQITSGKKMYLFPQWSPDGQKIVMIHGSNENHDVMVIENLLDPLKTTKPLSSWPFDDLRPVWSPDGSKIAFYSNYNLQGARNSWCIIVVAADGSDVASEDALSANVVAHQVIPDIEQGPAWMPDSRHIVYVKNDEQMFNPIYLVDIEEKTPIAVQTRTRMNHDISCAGDGTLAFRAQVERWDRIFIAKIDPEVASIEELK